MRLDTLFEDEFSDEISRIQAERVFEDIRAYLKRHENDLPEALQSITEGKFEGGFLLSAARLGESDFKDLSYIFLPSENANDFTASLGSYQGGKQFFMFLSVLKSPGNTQYLATRFFSTRTDFIHEFQHYLMRHRQDFRAAGSVGKFEDGGPEAYFNDDDETNAFYQEAAHRFIDLMRAIRNSDYSDKAVLNRKMDFWRNMSTQELVNLIWTKYTRDDFRRFANEKTVRAFKKRLARFVSQTVKPYIDPPIMDSLSLSTPNVAS